MDSGAWRVGADLFKNGYNVSIDVSFWQDQKDRERYRKKNNHRNLSLVTWQQGAPIHHSTDVGRPCSRGVKGQSSTIRKHKKVDTVNIKTRFVTQRFDNYSTRCRANLNICKSSTKRFIHKSSWRSLLPYEI